MHEVTPEPEEIHVIPIEHSNPIPMPAETKKPITGREYRRALKKAWFIFGVSFGFNIVQAVMIYILQAGPI